MSIYHAGHYIELIFLAYFSYVVAHWGYSDLFMLLLGVGLGGDGNASDCWNMA